MAFSISYPAWATTPALKLGALEKFRDKLITLYNRMGTWYSVGGVTIVQYNNLLPTFIKNRYAYTQQLSQADWQDFVVQFDRLTSKLADERNTQIIAIIADANAVNLEDITI